VIRLSIVFEFLGWLFWDFVVAFVLYTTGVLILRVVSFGTVKRPIFSFGKFNEIKCQDSEEFGIAYVMGFIFYVLVIGLAIWLS